MTFILYYLNLLVFFLSLVAFVISSSFLFHFSSFIYFFGIFLFFCASQESIMYFICKLLFSVLSLLAFCKSYERNAKTIRTIGKTKIPFDIAVGLFWSWASQFALFLPTLPSLSFYRQSTNPLPNHVPRALSYSSTKRTLGMTLPEASRGSAIQIFLVKVSIHVSPAEEGHWIGVIINTTVVRCRWHHHYFNLSSSSSPSNITTVVMSTIIPVLLVTEPHQTIASFL